MKRHFLVKFGQFFVETCLFTHLLYNNNGKGSDKGVILCVF